MNNSHLLSSYWKRKKHVLTGFLGTTPLPAADRGVIQTWFDGITKPAGSSLEEILEDKLHALNTERGNAQNSTDEHRRSARLLRLTQGATRGGPSGPGFYASIADVWGSPNNLKNALKAASEAAALFLAAVTNNGNDQAISAALKNLIDANPNADPYHLAELTELRLAILKARAARGGGEGSGYWPSTFISSSSSSGG